MKKNDKIKHISISLAAFAILGVALIYSGNKVVRYERYLKNMSDKAYSEIIGNLNSVSTSLSKMQYAGKGSYLNTLAANVWKEASSAKASLSLLPLSDVELDQTEKFISQSGAYAYSILQRGVDENMRQNIAGLSNTATELTDKLYEVKERVNKGEISLELLYNNGQDVTTGASDAISDIETEFPKMGTLIYDGPFSDHIEQIIPAFLENKVDISQEEALSKAQGFTQNTALKFSGEIGDKIKAYQFNDDNGVTIQVTKIGGFILSMTTNEQGTAQNISAEEAVNTAKSFLENNGYKNMTESYYIIFENNITINFAYKENGIKVYPDLIKVGVNMENGAISLFDSRGYIMSHKDRLLERPKISLLDAQSNLTEGFTVLENSMAIIPTGGKNEKFCYEFLCETEDKQQILVYIDAETGEEENMLILIQNENGTLTM